MIKVDRRQHPLFTRYDEQVVIDSLKMDFNKKCYICEEVTRHFEIEHFYPQKYYDHLIHNYSNLFYICQKCNKIKPKNINTNSEDEILNCCDINVENYIKLKLNILECKIEIIKIASGTNLDQQINNTIKLLDRVYNGVDSKSTSCEDLREDIEEIISAFEKKLEKYEKMKLKRAIFEEIIKELNKHSSYSTFKRWIIRDHIILHKEFYPYITDNKEEK